MNLIDIKFKGAQYYVPILLPADMSTGLPRNLLTFPPIDKLHVFESCQGAQKAVGSMGFDSEIKLLKKIDMDKIIQWTQNPKFANIDLEELENLEGLVVSIFAEIDEAIPNTLEMASILPLTQEIFYEPKMEQYKHPNALAISQEELQQKANNPILKKYYQSLVQNFERVMYVNDGIGAT